MARMTYTDAFNALEYLDSIGIGGETKEEAVQEMADALGDQDFYTRISQSHEDGSIQRAKDLDFSVSERKKAKAKKKQPEANIVVPVVSKDAPTYGEPMTQEQWDKIRGMYGSLN